MSESEPELLREGVYKQGEEVIVVLPSDKIVVIQEIAVEPVIHHHTPPTPTQPQQPSTLQQIKHQFSSYFTPQQPQPQPTPTPQPLPIPQASFSLQTLTQTTKKFQKCWQNFDDEAAFQITQFKRKYVLPVGDIPVRSVCMAVSTGLMYAVFGRGGGVLSRIRNFGICFAVNGCFWVPETFNPFLFRQDRR